MYFDVNLNSAPSLITSSTIVTPSHPCSVSVVNLGANVQILSASCDSGIPVYFNENNTAIVTYQDLYAPYATTFLIGIVLTNGVYLSAHVAISANDSDYNTGSSTGGNETPVTNTLNTYPQLIQGTTRWLIDVLNEQLITINTECESSITTDSFPQFSVFVGMPLNPENPVISINYKGTGRSQVAQHNYKFDLQFKLCILIPHSGDDSAESFEMARQVCADNLQCLFSDEPKTLVPKINAGNAGTMSAFSSSYSNIVDLNTQKSADGKTIIRGFEMPLTISYTLQANP